MAGGGIGVQAEAGLWPAGAGGALATAGGALDLAWVRRKHALGDAIDADTRTASADGPPVSGPAGPSPG